MPIHDFTSVPLKDLVSLGRKPAVVTGAGRVIGQAIAVRLAEAGAVVVLGDLDADPAKKSQRKFSASSASARRHSRR